jgi:hypothetical protein
VALPPVYTISLFSLHDLGVETVELGGPPAGFKWVIIDIAAWQNSEWYLGLNGLQVTDGLAIPFFSIQPPEARGGTIYHWEGRQVIEPSQSLAVVSLDLHWSVRATAYKLSTP